MKISSAVLIIGVITGLTYAILGLGLVLVYKSARFVNFAHGQLGALSALLLAKAVNDWGLPYWLVFPFAVALAAGIGVLVELTILRRLFDAPRLVLMVATIGIGQFLFALTFLKALKPDTTRLVYQGGYPTPIDWSVTISGQVLGGGEFMILILVPLAALGTAFLFRSTPVGLRIQAVAANAEAARLAGISVRRVSTTVWALAGALSALTAILLGPFRGTVNTETLGPGLMTRALAAALVGSMTNLPVTFIAGIALGVLEQVAFANFARGGTTELVVFLVMMAMLLWRASALAKESRRAEENLPISTRPRSPPADLREQSWTPWVKRVALLASLAIALLLPVVPGFTTQSKAFIATQVLVYGIIGLSLVVVTGWSGQLSLGQFAFVGVGAFVAGRLTPQGFSFPFVVIAGGLVGAGAAVLVGLPALKVRGLFLGVSTLAFAVVAQGWLFNQSWVTGGSSSSVSVGRPRLPFLGEVKTSRALYYVGLALLVVLAAMMHGLQASGLGRRLLAVRDNPKGAAAHGIPPAGVNIAGFALSGFIASAGGVLWGYANPNFDSNAFFPSISLAVLAMVVIGGLGSTTGALLGAVLVFGIPLFLGLSTVYVFLLSGVLLLAVLVFVPGGFMSLLYRVRDVILRVLARSIEASRVDKAAPEQSAPAVSCDEVTVRFGGLVALDSVSIKVEPGEIVGLIGANGAGKTTLMDCISGYLRPAQGRIRVNGRDISRYPPEFRAHFKVGRSFQDARLYPGLTVLETVMFSFERDDHVGMLSSLVGAPWQRFSERRKRERAEEVIDRLGLGFFSDTLVADLPTGLRRVCDLATAIAQRPALLVLDEPTAGIAQADVEAFIPLLRHIHEDLECAILIIEHDMSVVLGLAHRIYALEAGRVIAEGTPGEVANHPAVIASYLGTERVTIERSASIARGDGRKSLGGRPAGLARSRTRPRAE